LYIFISPNSVARNNSSSNVETFVNRSSTGFKNVTNYPSSFIAYILPSFVTKNNKLFFLETEKSTISSLQ